jgi:hypothetical protein
MAFRDPVYSNSEDANKTAEQLNKMFFDSVPENQRPDVANSRGFASPYTVYARGSGGEDGKGQWGVKRNEWLESEYNRSPGPADKVRHSNDMRYARNLATQDYNIGKINDAYRDVGTDLDRVSSQGKSVMDSILQNTLSRIRYV